VPTLLAACLFANGLLHAQSTSSELKELKDAIAAQQQQIQQLQQQVQSRDAAIQQLQQQVGQAQAAASQAQATAQSAVSGEQKETQLTAEEYGKLQHEVTDLKAVSTSTAEGVQATQKRVSDLESPLAIHYKGVTITPGGFLAAETVWRPHATFSDINTPLNLIPFSGAAQARFSEFYGSGRQTRLTLLAQGKWGTTNLTGYIETDFLGAGVTSNNNQSNSYVLRQRQLWASAALQNGWTFSGGQMWSLVTETRKGLDNRSEALPMQIDAQYTAGFSWARQYAFRAAKNFNNKVWLGAAVENAQTLLTVSGAPTFAPSPCPNGSTLVSDSKSPTGFAATCTAFNGFLIGGPGTLGGLYNNQANYSSNVSPDFVAKVAFEPGFGHYEVFGVASAFRNRIYPNLSALNPVTGLPDPSAKGAYNQTIWGGGWGANAALAVLPEAHRSGVARLGWEGYRPLWRFQLARRYRQSCGPGESSACLSGFGHAGMALAALGCLRLRRWRVCRKDLVRNQAGRLRSGRLRLASLQQQRLWHGNPANQHNRLWSRRIGQLRGSNPDGDRSDHRLLVQAIQRTEGARPNRGAIFLFDPRSLDRLWRYLPEASGGHSRKDHIAAGSHREYVVYLVPILPAVDRRAVYRRTAVVSANSPPHFSCAGL